ncbi:hypothetical protein HN748_00595 [Candidatus Peregrinibacteria bacterium]|jgi:hypothetical protein|nr:hypothetical protein [Candidatus Peregrinibacteria bacterium]MBT7702708.1 hypothetical protein [Candidatus Peregrinibacteria bacterium]
MSDLKQIGKIIISEEFIQADPVPALLDNILRAEYGLIKKDVAGVVGKLLGLTPKDRDFLFSPLKPNDIVYETFLEARKKLEQILEQILDIVRVAPLRPGDLVHLKQEPIRKIKPREPRKPKRKRKPLKDDLIEADNGHLIDRIKALAPHCTERRLIGAVSHITGSNFEDVSRDLRKPNKRIQIALVAICCSVASGQEIFPASRSSELGLLGDHLERIAEIQAINRTITKKDLYHVLAQLTDLYKGTIQLFLERLKRGEVIGDIQTLNEIRVGLDDVLIFLKEDPFFVNDKIYLNKEVVAVMVDEVVKAYGCPRTEAQRLLGVRTGCKVSRKQYRKIEELMAAVRESEAFEPYVFEPCHPDVWIHPRMISDTSETSHFGWTKFDKTHLRNGAGGGMARVQRLGKLN